MFSPDGSGVFGRSRPVWDRTGSSNVPLGGGRMKAKNPPLQNTREKRPTDVLQEFVVLFGNKGWLNRELRIRHRDGRYRIFCSERKFFAYRINDNYKGSWGFPGWPVCIVTHDQIIEDAQTPAFESTGPGAQGWLRCILEDDFDLI